jgi:hypothetical protein
MMIREALMPGVTDADQLTKIWNYRGTPDQILEQRWQHLSGWKSAKPQSEIQPQMRKSIEKLIIERYVLDNQHDNWIFILFLYICVIAIELQVQVLIPLNGVYHKKMLSNY